MRRRVTILAVVAAGLMALTGAAGFAAPLNAPVLTSATSSTTGIHNSQTVVGVSFLDAKQGYALIRTYSIAVEVPYRLDLYSTSDGGAAWRHVSLVRSSVAWAEDMPSENDLLVFANDRDGLIWLNTSQLLITHDGGLTWRSLGVNGLVMAAVLADSQRFIFEIGQGRCGLGPLGICSVNRLTSLPIDGYRTAPLKGAPTGMLQLGMSQAAPLLLWSEHSVYLSADGGTTWLRRSLPDPHECGEPQTVFVASSGPSALLFICDEGTPGPDNPKWVYRSTDGGESWQLVARTDRYLRLRPIGHVTEDGAIWGLAALSPARAVMVVQGAISSSADAGKDWTGTGLLGWPGGGLVCNGRNDCWAGWTAASTNPKTNAISSQPAILRTTNGGRTWQAAVLR